MTATGHNLMEQFHRAVTVMHRARHHMHHSGKGMHHGQGRLLALLGTMDGASGRELAERLDIRPSSLTELLDRLEEAGMIERRQSEEDKRVSHIHLTEAGRQAAEETRQARTDMVNSLFTSLDADEQDQLSALLDKLIAGMEAALPEDVEPEHRHGKHGHHGRHGHHGPKGRHGHGHPHGRHGPHGHHGPHGPHGHHGPHGRRECGGVEDDAGPGCADGCGGCGE